MCIVFSIHVLRNHTQCYEKIAGSQCNLYIGECHCPDDHPLVIRSQCMAPVEVDSWCEDDIQCQYHDNNTNCHQHKCQCHQDFIMSKTKTCIEGKKIQYLRCIIYLFISISKENWRRFPEISNTTVHFIDDSCLHLDMLAASLCQTQLCLDIGQK